jgi:hypothetical protein
VLCGVGRCPRQDSETAHIAEPASSAAILPVAGSAVVGASTLARSKLQNAALIVRRDVCSEGPARRSSIAAESQHSQGSRSIGPGENPSMKVTRIVTSVDTVIQEPYRTLARCWQWLCPSWSWVDQRIRNP